MSTTTAVCVDTAPPADGSAFSACTAVVWQTSDDVWPAMSAEDGATIGFAIVGLWGLAWALRLMRKQVERR